MGTSFKHQMMKLWSRLNWESQWTRGPENVPDRKLKQIKMDTLFLAGPGGPLAIPVSTVLLMNAINTAAV